MLKVGIPAPDFVGESTHGQIHMKDFIGKQHIILFFYPKDGTAVCTAQLTAAEAAYEEFKRNDAVVLGCNQDSLESHREFANTQRLSFPLISDPDMKIAKAYDVSTMEEYPNLVERTVFIIDLDGVICYGFKGNPSTKELLQAIDQAY